MTLITSGVIQRQLRRPFHKTSSKIALKGRLGSGIGAQLPKGSTLKATTVLFSNVVCSTFTAMSSRTLLSDYAYEPLKFDKIASITSGINCHDRAFRNSDDATMYPDLMAIVCGFGHFIHIIIH